MNAQERIIAYVQEMGSDADTLRDAAHEACHGLESDTDDWSRNGIHCGLIEAFPRGRSDLLAAEVRARAVERLVCEHFKVKYDSKNWLSIAAMETLKGGLSVPFEFWEKAVGNALGSKTCKKLAKQVIALGKS